MTGPASAGEPKPINCGLIGVGTVGSAVVDFFAQHPLELPVAGTRFGDPSSTPIDLWSAARRSRHNPKGASEELLRRVLGDGGEGSPRFFYDHDPEDSSTRFRPGAPAWRQVVSDENVDIVVELTGSPVAEAIIEEALWNGKCVVTANKKVMSRSGYELVRLAQARGTVLAYEASVGGGMPVVQMIGTSVGGKVVAMLAILNGTTNFILSRMRSAQGADGQAQGLAAYPSAMCAAVHEGLAEADPSDDVLGEDARSKLIILAGLAFGVRLRPRDVYLRGIARRGPAEMPREVRRADLHACPPGKGLPCRETCAEDDHLSTRCIFAAADLAVLEREGYAPKLLAGAQRVPGEGEEAERIVAWVQPAAVPIGHPLANVEGYENACLLQVESPTSGGAAPRRFELLARGPGAGGPQTASSVIADIQFCARQLALTGRFGPAARAQEQRTPLYMYGAGAFGRPQPYEGAPALTRTEELVAPFLLRFVFKGEEARGDAARAVVEIVGRHGIEASPLEGAAAAPEHLYYRTTPASMRAMEGALEGVLRNFDAGRMPLDVLYLPILEGARWAERGL